MSLAAAILLYFTCIADAGIDMLGVREIAEDRTRLTSLVPVVLSARLVIALGLIVLLCVFGLFVLPQPDGATLALYSLTLVWVAVNTRWVHLGLQQAGPVARSRVIGELVVFATVIVLVHAPAELARVPAAQFAGDGVAALLLLYRLRRLGYPTPWRLDWAAVRPVFRRSGHLAINAVLGLMIFNADLILLRVFRDSATVGYYAVAYTLVSFLVNLGFAYSLSLLPAITAAPFETGERQALYGAASLHVLAVAIPVAVGGALLAPGIMHLFFGPRFEPSVGALRLLLCSIPVAALRNVPQAALVAGQRQELVLRTSWMAAGLNLVLNLVLIPRFGMAGAAVSTGLTETIRSGLTIYYCIRVGLHPRALLRTWRPAVAALVMGLALASLKSLPVWAGVVVGALVYAAALGLLGGIRRNATGWPTLAD